MTNEQKTWPPEARDYPANRRKPITEEIVYQLQLREGEKNTPWHPNGATISDRDRLTLTQAYVHTHKPDEKQRVLRIEVRTYIDEVIGDGKGATSGADLLARNEQITEALKSAEHPDGPRAT